jgi:hypothetical protein
MCPSKQLMCWLLGPLVVALLRGNWLTRANFTNGLLEVWAWLEEVRHRGQVFKGYLIHGLFLSCFLYFLATMKGEPLLHHASPLWCSSLPQVQNNGISWWTKASETLSQNKSFFLLNCFSQVFGTVIKSPYNSKSCYQRRRIIVATTWQCGSEAFGTGLWQKFWKLG